MKTRGFPRQIDNKIIHYGCVYESVDMKDQILFPQTRGRGHQNCLKLFTGCAIILAKGKHNCSDPVDCFSLFVVVKMYQKTNQDPPGLQLYVGEF